MTRRVRLTAAAIALVAGVTLLVAGSLQGLTTYGVVLGLAGAAVAGFATGSLTNIFQRPSTLREQDNLVHRLWQSIRDFDNEQPFEDPQTGCLLTIDRHRGFTTLMVTETDGDREGLCRLYFLAFAGRPQPAPLLRRTDHLDLPEHRSVSWRDITDELDFGEATSAMHADTDEITDLIARAERAIRIDEA